MSALRNEKILIKNPIKKTRTKNIRSSRDIYQFCPVNVLLFEILPTKENVLIFFFFEQKQNRKTSEIFLKVAKNLNNIWEEFIKLNHVKICIVSLKQISTLVEKLVKDWQNLQKYINYKNNKIKEDKFVASLKFILNCAKGDDKKFFLCEEVNVVDLPRGKFEVLYFQIYF